jgi:hypothetical protein
MNITRFLLAECGARWLALSALALACLNDYGSNHININPMKENTDEIHD